jgi:acetoin utilization protein AcuC
MGPQHPLKPIRLERAVELLRLYGVLDQIAVDKPNPARVEDLRPCHSLDYLEAISELSAGSPEVPYYRFGFGSSDNPIFHGMWESSLLYTGASIDAAQALVDGRCRVAINLSGGLHHAHYSRAAGFCILNDAAAAIHRLKQRFAKVAYIDIDVHHGDGVQELFYTDPSVLTVSIHQSGQTLFPGTGFVHEIGEGPGEGFSLNTPVWPYTTDEIWLEVWREAAMPILRAFDPDTVCLQMGTDAHYLDPLAHVCLTAQGWLEAVKDVISLGRPIVAVGGGGYNQSTVPRMWTLAVAELLGIDLPDSTPLDFSFREFIPRLRDDLTPEVPERQATEAAAKAHHTIEELKQTLFRYHGI